MTAQDGTENRKKTGGRKAGVKNKRNRLVEEQIEKLMKKYKFDPLEAQILLAQQLEKDVKNAEKPHIKVATAGLLRQVLSDISPVVYAKRKAVEVKADVEHSGGVSFNIVTSGKYDTTGQEALKAVQQKKNE